MKKINLAVVTLLSAAVLLNGCAAFQNMSKTGKGATIGGASGAAGSVYCGEQGHSSKDGKDLRNFQIYGT